MAKNRAPDFGAETSCGTMSDDELSSYSDHDNGLFVKRVVSADPDYDVAMQAVPAANKDLDNCHNCHKPMPEDSTTAKRAKQAAYANEIKNKIANDLRAHQRRTSTSESSNNDFQLPSSGKVPTLPTPKSRSNSGDDPRMKFFSQFPVETKQPFDVSTKKKDIFVDDKALAVTKHVPHKQPPHLDPPIMKEKPCQSFKLNTFQCVENCTRRLLWGLSERMSTTPSLLIILSLLACTATSIGLIIRRHNLEFRPPFETYYNSDLDAKDVSASTTDALFNVSNSRYDSLQRMSGSDFAVIVKSSKAGNGVLKEEIVEGYLTLKKNVEDIKVVGGGKVYKYSTLCRHSQDSCEMDAVQAIMNSGKNIKFKFPEMEVPRANRNATTMFLGNTFGGVETDQEGSIAKAQTLAMHFKLKSSAVDIDDRNLVAQWDSEFQRLLGKVVEKKAKDFSVSWWSNGAFSSAVVEMFKSLYVYLGASVGVVFVGCLAICILVHGCGGQVWFFMGPVGFLVVSIVVGCAISADVGITGYLNPATFATYFFLSASTIFLLVTSMQSWRKYNTIIINPAEKLKFLLCWENPVLVLLSLVVAVSYAFTALATGTPLLRNVCQLMGFGFLVELLMLIFLFNSFLYICGKRDVISRKMFHIDEKGAAMFTTPILRRYSLRDMEVLHSKFLDRSASLSRRAGELLASMHVRYMSLLIFCVYLIFAAWGCGLAPVQLTERHYLRPSIDVDLVNYLNDYDRFYSAYDNYIEMLFGNQVDYYSPKVRAAINDVLGWVEFEQHLAQKVISWLRDFDELEKTTNYLVNRDTFVTVVDLIFLRNEKYKKYLSDVALGKYSEQILGSRMYLELNDIGVHRQLEIVKHISSLAKLSNLPLSLKSPAFFILEHDMDVQYQMLLALSLTICFLSAGSLMAFAQPLLSLISLVCMVSTTVGTLGFGALWNVPLNAINGATVLAGISYTYVLCISTCYFFNNAKYAGAKERLVYTYQSVLYGAVWSTIITVVSFVMLLVVDCELIVHQAKLVFFHSVFSLLHCCVFMPPCLILCGTCVPVFCRSLKEMCQESCCCCDTDEEATSIYYLPTGGRSVDPLYVQQFYRLKFREDINTPQPLTGPPRREMLMGPPVSDQPKKGSDIQQPDVTLTHGYPGSMRRHEDCGEHEKNVEEFDCQVPQRPKRRRNSTSPNKRQTTEPQRHQRQKGSPGTKQRGKKAEEIYTEPSDPENVDKQHPGMSRNVNHSSAQPIVESAESSVSGTLPMHVDEQGGSDNEEKSKNKISYAKWTKDTPLDAYTTERVVAEKYTIEADGNRIDLPPDWKRFWLKGNVRGGSGAEPEVVGMVPNADPQPQRQFRQQYTPQSPNMMMPPEYYAPEPPPMYGGGVRMVPRQRVVHGYPQSPMMHQYPPRPMQAPPGNYRKPTHW